ncbi:hypothetical protein PIB30_022521 [Stylosanthes scabra]|uniref:LysM domain-containing protein n=1 Tax=Stylosanthes scabra TaxID=79078 RepID=A0ABU6V8Q3_9FABA|nr:hypothetical protein [Stylosanthes scabra]
MELRFRLVSLFFLFLLVAFIPFNAESKCTKSCGLALASYYPHSIFKYEYDYVTYVSETRFRSRFVTGPQDIANYNKNVTTNTTIEESKYYIRLNIPFPCECINGDFLGHTFHYPVTSGDSYESIAELTYSNLVTAEWLSFLNVYSPNEYPNNGTVNVTVNCSCGDSHVSKDYGLFITYPLRPEDSLESIANQTNLDPLLLLRYNPGVNFSQGSGLVYIPGKALEV